MNRNVKKIVLSGLIAAMYVVLTLLQNREPESSFDKHQRKEGP